MSVDPRHPVDDLRRLSEELREFRRRLDLLEAPSGTQAFRTVAKLELLVADIQAQLEIYNASRWTNAQILEQIDARVYAIIGSILAGNVSIGGALTVQGTVTLPGARATNLASAANRTNAWLAGPTDNRLGYT